MREDIRKRREKYENVITPAMRMFGGGKELLLERKSGMNIEDYTYMRKLQSKALKLLFKRDPLRRVARLMIPTTPSPHLQLQVARHQAIKQGWLEEVKKEASLRSNFISRWFNSIRTIFAQNNGLSTTV